MRAAVAAAMNAAGAGPAYRREACRRPDPATVPLTEASRPPREFFIHGITSTGRPFRPSDWAERLSGVMSAYRPGSATGRDAHLGCSPYARPVVLGGVKCVVVDERLHDLEPLAFSFLMNFARDNDLPVSEGCSLPDARR